MLNLYKSLSLLLGYGLIVASFILFGTSLEISVLVLDIIVSLLIFTQFALHLFFPLINLNDASHKEVGMMGLHFLSIGLYIPASLLLMILGFVFNIPFTYQLIGQLLFLFLLLIGRVVTLQTGKTVHRVYHKEQNIKAGKEMLKRNFENFVEYISESKSIDPSIVDKVHVFQESIRFITPSSNPEALQFDTDIINIIENLKILMRDVAVNRDKINDEMSRLERALNRRKKC